ncbi:MAG TPA: thiol-disulfide oxidoreductase, partial [Candidatus Poseidoniales archaeon]|nr:thiol-disulfide oxidoreductase [Candidatus Poseidoniales archaeon]
MADATLLYDGSCRVCSGWAEFVSKSDPKAHIEL